MLNINNEIARLDWSREPQGLYAPIAYTLQAGGKRLRPQLCLTACRMFGGNEKHALPAALALEVFHNFTLLHDDVMDHADIRRGRPTVHVKWNENTAILSGDQMMIEAYKLLQTIQTTKLPEVLRLFNKMATEICEGQQYDVDFEHRNNVSIPEYMEMIRLKTSVLLATALQIGGLIADATPAEQILLYEYGIRLGLAFQLQDDLLDCFGNPETFGKAIGGDICCNKKTFLLLTALKNATEEQARDINHWLSITNIDNEKIEAVKTLYVRTGAKEKTEQAILAQTEQAIICLNKLPQNDETQSLRTLADNLAKRTN